MSQKKLRENRKKIQDTGNRIQETNDFLPKFLDILKKYKVFLLIACGLAVLLYANAMGGAFVSDDYATLPQNQQLGNFAFNIKKDGMLLPNTMVMTNFFINKLFGVTSPVPYHIVSLLWYLATIVLSFVFLILVFKNDLLAKVATIIFIFMPIHVEAVSWNAGKIYLILATYILASVINFIYFIDREKPLNLYLALGFFWLAFATDRPRPFAIFLILILYIMCQENWREITKRYLKYWMVVLAILIVSVLASLPAVNIRVDDVNSGTNASESYFYSPFFQYPLSIPKYLQLNVFPVDLTLYHTMFVLPGWLNWLILLSYLGLLIYFFIYDKRYFFALAFIFMAVAPSMAPVKVSWLVAERYMFLGSLGMATFIALLLVNDKKRISILSLSLLVGLCGIYGYLVLKRNVDWRTNHNLWVKTCQVSPNSHNAWNNIGDDYDKLGQYENAVKGFTQSTLVKPNYADAFHNRANILFKMGRLDLAKDSYETAVTISPNLYQSYLSISQIAIQQKDYVTASENLEKALKFVPGDPQVLYFYAVVQANLNKIDEAKRILNSIVLAYPEFVQARQVLTALNKGQTLVP